MSRIPQIATPSGLSDRQLDAWNEILSSRGVVRGPFSVLLHSPDIARRTAQLGSAVKFESTVDARVRALVSLVVARYFDCQFAWSSNESDARTAGLSEATIGALRERRAPDGLAEDDVVVFTLVDELLRTHRVPPGTFARMLQRFGTVQLVEIVGCIGYYAHLSMILNAFEVPSAPYFVDLLPVA